MPTLPGSRELYQAVVHAADDFESWRDQARAFVAAGVAPEHIVWSSEQDGERDLFALATPSPSPLSLPPAQRDVRANKAFLHMAGTAILHRDPQRWSLLYRILWRLQDDRHLMDKPSDRDIHKLSLLFKQVRRDIHKMRAFVRFRTITEADGEERYLAWFEPDHHIVRANADFFLNRFASNRWSILTPEVSLHWDGAVLTESQGASAQDVPDDDAAEDLWKRYYSSIFNPARLKVSMMVKEMPRRYWKNLPEAALIPELIAGAQAREAMMVELGKDAFAMAMPQSLDDIAQGISQCRRCAIGCNGTRAVAGEGPLDAPVLAVGEQPGDSEEREGRPFVGPAGQVLDRHLAMAGLDRSMLRMTNAVKHFKFTQQGDRRLHRSPSAGEIDTCRWWLDAERALVRPRWILALGASAGRAILGRTPSINRERGQAIALPDGTQLWLTVHPSYLLRIDPSLQERESARFLDDLTAFATTVGAG